MTNLLEKSAAHHEMMRLVGAAASNDAEVLIMGPSGVGKELYARALHERGHRSAHSFVPVNCGALPPDLFENELFGHIAGAFTGARPRAVGLVQEADRGTLFLDEIDALHVANQVKLLRLIQEKEYRPLGESRVRKVNLRIVAATNADLSGAAKAGRFRSDLFFRLRVIPIEVPPLKDRLEDLSVLLEHFVERYSREYRVEPVRFSRSALDRLHAYTWPGNIRELENCARYLICTNSGATIECRDLPLLDESTSQPEEARRNGNDTMGNFQAAKQQIVDTFEKGYLQDMLARYDGNIAAAARASGKHRRAFFELMRRHGLTRSTRGGGAGA
jgi:DNA-binding NtrC family response regulator